MQKLSSTSAVIKALGDTAKVAAMFGVRAQVVSNWKSQPQFPAHSYKLLTSALKAKGLSAPDSLWRFSVRPLNPIKQPEAQA